MAASIESDQNLIDEIVKYPILYDSRRADYKDANKKNSAWKIVATKLGINGSDCRRRWKTLRERYVRERKRLKFSNNLNSGINDKWPLFEQMSFLGVFIKHRNSLNNFSPHDVPMIDASNVNNIKQEEASNDSVHEDLPVVVMVTSISSPSPASTVSSLPTVTSVPTITPVPVLAPLPTIASVSTLTSLPTVSSIRSLTPVTTMPSENIMSSESRGNMPSADASSVEIFSHSSHEDSMQVAVNHNKKKYRESDYEKSILQRLESSLKYFNNIQTNHWDAEDHFAMSIACTLRKLPSQKAAIAKIKIQQLLYELEFQN